MTGQHAVVAMSGGVDSSLAAALMLEKGYQVTGMMLKLWTADCDSQENACCTPEAIQQARDVAGLLGIPFYVIDAREIFKSLVVDRFITGSFNGLTPNPCYWCNKTLRWGFLLDKALAMGADYLVTGHYARIAADSQGMYHLYKGIDATKDQSYVLSGLNQAQLSKTMLPLGDLTKQFVRAEARRRGIAVANKPDSQDLCFVGGKDYRRFLDTFSSDKEMNGNIVDKNGRIIGSHTGLHNYTIGQRKGLGSGNDEPIYVTAKNVANNELVVGLSVDLEFSRIFLGPMNWIDGRVPDLVRQFDVKIRYKAKLQPAKITLVKGECIVEFANPVRDATPGQIMVIYENDEVIGSGEIVRTERERI